MAQNGYGAKVLFSKSRESSHFSALRIFCTRFGLAGTAAQSRPL